MNTHLIVLTRNPGRNPYNVPVQPAQTPISPRLQAVRSQSRCHPIGNHDPKPFYAASKDKDHPQFAQRTRPTHMQCHRIHHAQTHPLVIVKLHCRYTCLKLLCLSIRYEPEHSNSHEIAFLDTMFRLENGKIETSLYSKTTDKHIFIFT